VGDEVPVRAAGFFLATTSSFESDAAFYPVTSVELCDVKATAT